MKISISTALKLLLWGTRASALTLLFFATADVSEAQSTDISYPSPIRAKEVSGTIAARDLGDSRLTDHFYAFTGMPGDVLITVKGNNLNGDIDLFTAGSLQPLMKFTLYAENSAPATRSIFLRRREDLILRVQARTPNDDEGMYQIRLGGSSQPIADDAPIAEARSPQLDPASATTSGGRRVSSVGARIAEPPVVREEVVAAPTPQPTPEESEARTTTPKATATTEAPAAASPRARGRGRVPPTRRRTPPQPPKQTERSASETTKESEASETTAKANTPATASRRTGRRGTLNRPTEQIPVQEPQTGPRLVIEMRDGTRIERFMSTIRRVTVENNQIVVVRKDGIIERNRMSDVLRMAIEP